MKYKKGLPYIKIRLLLFLYFSIIFIILRYVFLNYLFIISFVLVVANGMYTIHSMEAPFMQEDAFLNDCWRSKYGLFHVDKFCQVFITRIPALSKEASTSRDTVSFESACRPGYFLRQKNYNFILQKRDGTELFGRYTSESFAFRSRRRGMVLPYISYDM